MRLWSGHDREPPIFVGPGHIDLRSSTAIDFTMFATPSDGVDASRRLVRARENSYEVFDQFRLTATDYQGTEWMCGWTQPKVKGIPKVGWPLTGELSSLMTVASGPWVSTESGVELVFRPKFWLPMDKAMVTVTSVDGTEIQRRHSAGQQTIHVLDSEIRFFYPPSNASLWVTAKTSDKLSHPHVENWLSEPLRVLLGQLIFPRLVARNFGGGTAHVWLRPSPRRFKDSGIASLIGGDPRDARTKFWELYASLLTLIAEAKDEHGHPNFDPHRITRFYEEIIQATHGSRWVLCMTLASAAEGILRLLRPETRKVDNYMKKLVQSGILVDDNQQSWTAVRHAVMHGKLVSPWPTEEEDKRILDLADLVHRLTRELISEGVKAKEDPFRMSKKAPPDSAGPRPAGT
jgi:hypothetical protein